MRPIVGAEINVDGRPAAFLARTQRGYENLAALVTLARVGQWEEWDKKVQGKRRGRPKVTWAQVAATCNGLACADRSCRGRARVIASSWEGERSASGISISGAMSSRPGPYL